MTLFQLSVGYVFMVAGYQKIQIWLQIFIYTCEAQSIITKDFFSNLSRQLKWSFGGTFGIFQFNHI